jgi:hypothetical protein
MGFEHGQEAERFLAELRQPFAKFGLKLHADKTRIVEFGRNAEKIGETGATAGTTDLSNRHHLQLPIEPLWFH